VVGWLYALSNGMMMVMVVYYLMMVIIAYNDCLCLWFDIFSGGIMLMTMAYNGSIGDNSVMVTYDMRIGRDG